MSNNKSYSFIKKNSNSIIRILLVTVLLILIFSMIYSGFTVYLSNRINAPLINYIREFRYEIVSAYLELENSSGRRTRIIIDINSNIAEAENNRKAVLNKISNKFTAFFLPDSIEKKIDDLNNSYDNFIKVFNNNFIAYQKKINTFQNDPKLAELLTIFRDNAITCVDEIESFNISQLYLFGSFQAASFIIILFGGIFIIIYYQYSVKMHKANIIEINDKNKELNKVCMKLEDSEHQLKANEQQLKAANQQLTANEQQLKAANQQLMANEQQLKASNQQLMAANKELHANEEALIISESFLQLYKKSVEYAEDLITAIDRRYEIVFANSVFKEYYNIDFNMIAGKKINSVIDEIDFKISIKDDIDNCIKGSKIRHDREFKFPRMGSRLMQVTYYPLLDENEKDTIVIMVMKDITDRLKIEEERQKVQKLESVGLLAGGIAHDFNNLLQGIFGYIGLAKESCGENTEICNYLNGALSAFKRAKNLTEQLLTFSKGGLPIKTAVKINELVNEAIKFNLSGSNIKSKIKIDEDLWLVEADEGQMHQVFSNILINARQSMPNGGNIIIDVKNRIAKSSEFPQMNEGNYIEIKIQDEGHGISKEHLSKIFDPFFTTKQNGSGLGLSIAYSIIKKHNGYISADSTLGNGSTFIIYLPVMEIQDAKKGNNVIKLKKGSGTIIIMDDEDSILDIAKKYFESYGYSALIAKDGESAIEILKKLIADKIQIKAVILDLTVPGRMGGKEAVKIIKKLAPDLKVLVSSGYYDDPVFSEPSHYGFDGAIAKPYEIKKLIEAVQKFEY